MTQCLPNSPCLTSIPQIAMINTLLYSSFHGEPYMQLLNLEMVANHHVQHAAGNFRMKSSPHPAFYRLTFAADQVASNS